METLERAEQLKAELDSLRPLDSEAEARIIQKFRLDWNYHSNNIEGNSLTYGETKALILFGITAQGKPLKDHFEITGHNEAINWVLDLVKGETELTEVFIRELHTLLLKESSWKEAVTPDGKATRRKIEVGKYKTQPNHVITITGETFYFATPEETPVKMQELVEWFREEKSKSDVNPIILAALFHYKFIRIHPFDDGNGRVARILMNFILMQFGFPPVIIKTEDKENYYAVLRLADADQLGPFIEYITANLLRSLEIMIRGARGEEIEEPEDLDKELALLEKRLRENKDESEIEWSYQIVRHVLYAQFKTLLTTFVLMCQKFDRFYFSSKLTVKFISEPTKTRDIIVFADSVKDMFLTDIENLSARISQMAVKTLEKLHIPELVCLEVEYKYKTLLAGDPDTSYKSFFSIEFNETNYGVVVGYNLDQLFKPYSQGFSYPEIEQLVKIIGVDHKKAIEELAVENNHLKS